MSCLCGIQWSNSLNSLLNRLCRIPKVNGSLSVEPKLWAGAEQPGKTQGHRRTHGATLAEQLVSGLARHPQSRCKSAHRQPIIRKKILAKHLSGMSWANLPFPCIRDAHNDPLISGNPLSLRRTRQSQQSENRSAIEG